ncbi:MAG: EAL domain-containing protein [Pseudomonadota bacterium]|uniref:Diguanylate cyclase (GGDEF)-like protein n=1 Tax=Gallaecimonas pentaromativorans TaxID=584787 RepID=A0A3N1PG10_9GAMM|nr:EAL domain-containing protein [Gallaecimonas pentaromativorans]MED5526613.1 EAL domain-containing protein [Pseudomonadota bacterium]ROQ25947.1 diguanylate cyclase (GGDEF)-like protein [Gallaecimonas pentaromativorans]
MPTRFAMIKHQKAKLSRRLMLSTLSLSFLMMVMLIPVQYFMDKKEAENGVAATSTQIVQGYLPTLAAAIWNFDPDRTRLNLQNLIQQPFAAYAAVNGDIALTVGVKPVNSIDFQYPIVADNGSNLGQLSVSFDKDAISQYAWNKVRSAFWTLSIYTLLLAGLLLWLVQKVVTRRLLRLSQFAQGLRLDNLETTPTIYFKHSQDELDHLTKNLLDMRNQLAADRNELKRFETELARRASEDQLTGLPNRFSFLEALYRQLETDAQFSLMFLDLDGFKKVNDGLGHSIGDELLKKTAQRLKELGGECSFLARYGGDEFVILVNQACEESIKAIADRLTEGFSRPFHVAGNVLYLSVSIGIARHPEDADNGEELIQRADVAMYQAKNLGRSRYLFFDQCIYDNMRLKLSMEEQLRKSLEQKDFTLVYQPIYNTHSGKIVSAEALLRWPYGSPDVFIPLAEETGLILPLGLWVLEEALAQAKRWQDAGTPLVVSVNVSHSQLHQPSFADKVCERLQKCGLEPSILQLEITETALMEDWQVSIANIQKLRDMGVRIALDDFGTGYSSLSHLQQLPLDCLKIDKSFMARIHESPRDMALVQALVELAKALSLKVVAEGIEYEEQMLLARTLGIHYLQGFFLAKPQPVAQLELNRSFAALSHGASASAQGVHNGTR